MRYCRFCGKELQGGQKFCPHCGCAVEEAPPAEAEGQSRPPAENGGQFPPPPVNGLYGQGNGYAPPPYGQYPYYMPPVPEKKPINVCGLIGMIIAIFTMTFGWLFLGGILPVILAIAAVVLSAIGLATYKKYRLSGCAVAGLIIGIIAFLLFLIFFIAWMAYLEEVALLLPVA